MMTDEYFIAKDTILRSLNKLKKQFSDYPHADFTAAAIVLIDYIIGMIKGEPGVETGKVIHGSWVPCGVAKPYFCDICGHLVKEMTTYCPNCGALMDKTTMSGAATELMRLQATPWSLSIPPFGFEHGNVLEEPKWKSWSEYKAEERPP